MDVTPQKYMMIEKLINFVSWLTKGHWQIVASQKVDALHAEIYQLEKTLASAPTRPTRTIRRARGLEPITEHQKIMDLAG